MTCKYDCKGIVCGIFKIIDRVSLHIMSFDYNMPNAFKGKVRPSCTYVDQNVNFLYAKPVQDCFHKIQNGVLRVVLIQIAYTRREQCLC